VAAPPVSAVASVSGPVSTLSVVPAGHVLSGSQQTGHKPAPVKQQASTLEPGMPLSHCVALFKLENGHNDH
jgi:hypothetical protein